MKATAMIVKVNKFGNIMCFCMLQYIMCGASVLTSQIHAATFQFTIRLFSVLILAACQKRLFTYMYHMNQNLWKSTSDGIIFFQRC